MILAIVGILFGYILLAAATLAFVRTGDVPLPEASDAWDRGAR